jgi:hypothetical protein
MRNVLLVAAVLLAACAPIQMYEGKKLDQSELALIKAGPDINPVKSAVLLVKKVDGKRVSIGSNKIEVLPGKHALEITCQLSGESVLNTHMLDVEVAAGKTYNIGLKLILGSKKCEGVLTDG